MMTLGAWAAHPSLLLTAEGVAEMREARGQVPTFDAAMTRTLSGADAALAAGDRGSAAPRRQGRLHHERHKLQNTKWSTAASPGR